MDIYHIWFNLKAGVRDTEFAQSVHSYLGYLKEQGSLVDYRLIRRKLGLGPPQLPLWNITIKFENLTQMDRAFNRVAARTDRTRWPEMSPANPWSQNGSRRFS